MYIIYLNNKEIATIDGTEIAYECFQATETIALATGQTASLVDAETAEVVAFFDPDKEEEEEYYKYISEKFKYSKRAKESEEVVGQMQEAYKLIDEAIDILMKYLLIDYT